MLNVDKVRGRMAEMRLTQKDVAAALGIAVPTASQKLNRVRPMDLDEAEKLANLLNLEDSQVGEYFLPGSCVTQHKEEVNNTSRLREILFYICLWCAVFLIVWDVCKFVLG